MVYKFKWIVNNSHLLVNWKSYTQSINIQFES